MDKTFTLIYEKKNLFTYIMKINPNDLVRSMNAATVYSILTYAIVGSKDNPILGRILEKILEEMKDELGTKAYLKEILTGEERFNLRFEYRYISFAFLFSFDIQPPIEEAPSSQVCSALSIYHGQFSSQQRQWSKWCRMASEMRTTTVHV